MSDHRSDTRHEAARLCHHQVPAASILGHLGRTALQAPGYPFPHRSGRGAVLIGFAGVSLSWVHVPLIVMSARTRRAPA